MLNALFPMSNTALQLNSPTLPGIATGIQGFQLTAAIRQRVGQFVQRRRAAPRSQPVPRSFQTLPSILQLGRERFQLGRESFQLGSAGIQLGRNFAMPIGPQKRLVTVALAVVRLGQTVQFQTGRVGAAVAGEQRLASFGKPPNVLGQLELAAANLLEFVDQRITSQDALLLGEFLTKQVELFAKLSHVRRGVLERVAADACRRRLRLQPVQVLLELRYVLFQLRQPLPWTLGRRGRSGLVHVPLREFVAERIAALLHVVFHASPTTDLLVQRFQLTSQRGRLGGGRLGGGRLGGGRKGVTFERSFSVVLQFPFVL